MTSQPHVQTLRSPNWFRIAGDALMLIGLLFGFITGITYVYDYAGAPPAEVFGTLSIASVYDFLSGEVAGMRRWIAYLELSLGIALVLVPVLDRLDPD